MKKLISLLIVLFLFSGFSISQVGETELIRTTQEQKEKEEKFTPEQRLNWEEAKQEAVEKREAILEKMAEEIDEFLKENAYYEMTENLRPMREAEIEKFIEMIKNFRKQEKRFEKELKLYNAVATIELPIRSYAEIILKGLELDIEDPSETYEVKTDFGRSKVILPTHPERTIREVKLFRKAKGKLQKSLKLNSSIEIEIPVVSYAEIFLKQEKLSIKEFFQKMAANGRIVKNEVKKFDKKIKQFDKLEKKLRKGLKIKKEQITVKIPEDWRGIHYVGFDDTRVYFRDNKKEEIRTIVAKWTGQDTKVVKANRYSEWRFLNALIIALVVFGVIFLLNKSLWISVVIGLAVGICYFIFW